MQQYQLNFDHLREQCCMRQPRSLVWWGVSQSHTEQGQEETKTMSLTSRDLQDFMMIGRDAIKGVVRVARLTFCIALRWIRWLIKGHDTISWRWGVNRVIGRLDEICIGHHKFVSSSHYLRHRAVRTYGRDSQSTAIWICSGKKNHYLMDPTGT